MKTVWTARKPLFLDSPQTNGRTRVGIRHWMPWGSWDERSLKCRRATKLKILERFQHQPLVLWPTKSEEARFDLCHFSLYGRSRWHSRCLGIGRMGAPRRGRWTRVVVGRLDATTPAVMRQSRRVWRMEGSEENASKVDVVDVTLIPGMCRSILQLNEAMVKLGGCCQSTIQHCWGMSSPDRRHALWQAFPPRVRGRTEHARCRGRACRGLNW